MSSRTRIIVALLVVVNLSLLGYLFGFMAVFLAISMLLNIGTLWFVAYQFKQQNKMLEGIEFAHRVTELFRKHLEDVYALEEYYGDQEIHDLILHARQLNNDLVDFLEKYSFVEVAEGDEEVDENEDEKPAEEAASKEKNAIQ